MQRGQPLLQPSQVLWELLAAQKPLHSGHTKADIPPLRLPPQAARAMAPSISLMLPA